METQQIVIVFLNAPMLNAIGESDRICATIDLTEDQKKKIQEFTKMGYSVLSIHPVAKSSS